MEKSKYENYENYYQILYNKTGKYGEYSQLNGITVENVCVIWFNK